MALADDIVTLRALGEVRDAYTTGTTANQALSAQADLVSAEIDAQVAATEAAISGMVLGDPAAVLTAVTLASALASGVIAQAWLTQLETVLRRA